MKAIVIFGTTTGNTETVAGVVKEVLIASGMDVTMENVIDVTIGVVKDYDLVVLGASTWGEGEIQDDFIPFFDKMDSANFKDKKVAVFGCGNSEMYPDYFCEAVKMIQEKAVECGAKVINELCKIDGDVEDALEDVKSWAKALAASI